MDVVKIQKVLNKNEYGGWLLYDFHNRDPLAMNIAGMDSHKFSSRRWFYFIPANGEPVTLASVVEQTMLDHLPGKKLTYRAWKELHAQIKAMLGGQKTIAMNYSPLNHIPYVSMVDAGTIELIRHLGYEIVSAADLIQEFESIISESGFQSHAAAGERVLKIKDEAYAKIAEAIHTATTLSEYELQQYIMGRFEEEGLTCEGHGPIVGINEHPADPHFEPKREGSYIFKPGDTVLIDLWAKEKSAGAIYYDVTWCGYIGENPPPKYVEIFNTVRDARNAAKLFVESRFEEGKPCFGWEVDDVCRAVIENAGYGEYFVHRTGHSIGTSVHGNGANIDNLETKDERQLIAGICFSIEPGIYLEGDMAVRTEINVCILPDGTVKVFGDEQDHLILVP